MLPPFIDTNLIWTEGLPILAVLTALTALFCLVWRNGVYLCLIALIFSFYFFRNPMRICLEAIDDPSVIVCPTDGKVVDIVYSPDKPLIEGSNFAYKISFFLSIFDVHTQWTFGEGSVENIAYFPGKFVLAFLPKSSLVNEHNDILIRSAFNDQTVLIRQIAGTCIRRIVCWVHEGESLTPGHQIGMIKFGSRVDLFLPDGVELFVGLGQQVMGGKTVLGKFLNRETV